MAQYPAESRSEMVAMIIERTRAGIERRLKKKATRKRENELSDLARNDSCSTASRTHAAGLQQVSACVQKSRGACIKGR
jgi:hypothetical protein